ncbi:hypothetical protein GCM10010129_05520 [Streptomyces fumigatiscleroticus]|nr:hypothetical protein GCM10010129_05520 [Streptomyces fumigatiscleroticus]
MDLDSVADELYGLRPEEFTAARDARAAAAREAGDRALAGRIGKLRRPNLAAWANNLLVREQTGEIGPLLSLGEALRRAHQDLDGAQLRELSGRQRVLVDALARQAAELAAEAGHPLGDSARREVENTLHAVLADPDAARRWAAGRLVRPLDAAVGFPAAADGAAARPAPAAPSRPAARRDGTADAERRRRLARARQEAEDAERDLRAVRDEARAAGREAEDAGERAGGLGRRADELAGELERVRQEEQRARAAGREAREKERDADRRVREARRRARTAAAQVRRLTERGTGRRGGEGGEK